MSVKAKSTKKATTKKDAKVEVQEDIKPDELVDVVVETEKNNDKKDELVDVVVETVEDETIVQVDGGLLNEENANNNQELLTDEEKGSKVEDTKRSKEQKTPKAVERKEGTIGGVSFHKFDFRDEAVINVNFNVLHEINRVQKDHEVWNKAEYFDDSRYRDIIVTIITLLDTYENVRVRESKNDRFLNKEQLLKGHFYER